ncbi:hypothetical protein HZA56_04920 [Candidatus Poribacteria bacterium]|nr:hypothetical protein [Candidatus Poribacteria bacterium]
MERDFKKLYVKPMVLATYSKEELEETIKPHGSVDSYTDGGGGGCGCGCGGGSILQN